MFRWLVPASLRSSLRIYMDFENRRYILGEIIDLTVMLKSSKGVQIREARVDLVCDHRYAESYTRMISVRHPGALLMRGTPAPETMVPKREIIERVESHVRSTAVFLQDGRLDSGSTSRHDVRLEIQTMPTLQTLTGVFSWTLFTTVNVSGGRDVVGSQEVTVDVG